MLFWETALLLSEGEVFIELEIKIPEGLPKERIEEALKKILHKLSLGAIRKYFNEILDAVTEDEIEDELPEKINELVIINHKSPRVESALGKIKAWFLMRNNEWALKSEIQDAIGVKSSSLSVILSGRHRAKFERLGTRGRGGMKYRLIINQTIDSSTVSHQTQGE